MPRRVILFGGGGRQKRQGVLDGQPRTTVAY
jgi:hypothetical protein